MRLTGYPTSCLTLAVTLVNTTRQQRETLPIAGFALDADKWSGTGSISAGTRAMIWSTPARSITASRRNQKRSCMTASGHFQTSSRVPVKSVDPIDLRTAEELLPGSGLYMIPMCSKFGDISLIRATHLPPRDGSNGVKPVTLPPGLEKLST